MEKGHSLHTIPNLISAVDYRCGEHGGNKMLGTDTYDFTGDGVSLSSFRLLRMAPSASNIDWSSVATRAGAVLTVLMLLPGA